MSVTPVTDRSLAPLPSVQAPLLGRDREREELRALLTSPEVRLVTLLGPGGIGKTRLAIEVATEVLDEGLVDVAFLPLASIRFPELVSVAIGQAFDLQIDPQEESESDLFDGLVEHRALLVLDNLEQVLGVAPFLERLLDRCPGITILATSQVALGIDGERRYPLAPLVTPDPATTSHDSLLESAAVALFVDRARAILPEMPLDEGTIETIAAICRRLDGLPLAIELAAARANLVSPTTLLSRLDDQLRILGSHRGDVPDRLRTIGAAVAWSYDLLKPAEQSLFRRLALFSGGFAADAARAVFDGPDEDADAVLQTLVARSLIQAGQSSSGERRYLMLESLRSYGLEQLSRLGEREDALLSHAMWVTNLAEQAEPHIVGSGQQEWFLRLDAEMENIRAAVTWAMDHERPDLVLRIVSPIWQYFAARGLVTESRAWLDRALAAGGADALPWRAKALNAAGYLARERHDRDASAALFEQARHLAVATGNIAEQISALHGLGHVAIGRHQYTEGLALNQEAIRLAHQIGEDRLVAVGESNLGLVSFFHGDMEGAVGAWERALPIISSRGDVSGEALLLSNIGSAKIRMTRLEEARDYTLRALALQRQLGTRQRLLSTLNNLGIIHIQLGEYERAAEVFAEAMEMHREDANLAGQASIAHSLANLELDRGNIQGAAAWFVEAMQLRAEVDHLPDIFDYTGLLIAICHEGGYHEETVELLAADARLRRELDYQMTAEDEAEIEKETSAARAALSDREYEDAWRRGSEMESAVLIRRLPIIGRTIAGRRHPARAEHETAPPDAPLSETLPTPGNRSAFPFGLTSREVEILHLVAKGATTREIASTLSISPRTAATHVSNILGKLDVHNRTTAVSVAMRAGVL